MQNLFENIHPRNIEKLKRILQASAIRYRKNVNVLSNVNREDFIGIIDSGSVQLIYNDYDGNKTIIEEISEGEIFGSINYILQAEEITCITKEDTQRAIEAAYIAQKKWAETSVVERCEILAKFTELVLKNKDELDQYFISATLQEDKQYNPLEEEKCETCSGCGFH